jgi:DNA polymerase-3 subunit epsilon
LLNFLKKTSLPSGIDEDVIDEIPETSGVYLFFGENKLPLYIGKSVNLRARVMSHFSSYHSSTKEMRISQEIKHIEWIETAGEFGALLLESRLVKERQPIHNRQLRRERQLCAWQLAETPDCTPLITLIRDDEITAENMGSLFGTFRSKKQATDALRNIAEENSLCLKALGLESGKGPCFRFQIKRCKGICCDKESPELHFLRLKQALISLKLKSWGFKGKIGIKEHNPTTNKTELHIFYQWCHIATVDEDSHLEEAINSKYTFSFDLDTYKLLLKELGKRNTSIITL